MSDYDHKEMTGTYFKNKKQKESHPDIRGECKLNGVTYSFAGWNKQGGSGTPFVSLKFEEKQASGGGQSSQGGGSEPADFF